jgi:chromosome segregation ATPase
MDTSMEDLQNTATDQITNHNQNGVLKAIHEIADLVEILKQNNASLLKENEAISTELDEKSTLISRLYYSMEQLNAKIDYLAQANDDFAKGAKNSKDITDGFEQKISLILQKLSDAQLETEKLKTEKIELLEQVSNFVYVQKEMLQRKKESLEKDKIIEAYKEKVTILENKNFGAVNQTGEFASKYEEFIARIYSDLFSLKDRLNNIQKLFKHNNEISNLLLQQVANTGLDTYQLQIQAVNVSADKLYESVIRERNTIENKFEEFKQNIKQLTKTIEIVQDKEDKESTLLSIIEEKFNIDKHRTQENIELKEKIRRLNDINELEKTKLREALKKTNETLEALEEQNRSLTWRANQLISEKDELNNEFSKLKKTTADEMPEPHYKSEIGDLRRRNDILLSKMEELKMITRRNDKEGLHADLIESYIELDALNEELEQLKNNLAQSKSESQHDDSIAIDKKKATELVTRIELFINKMNK